MAFKKILVLTSVLTSFLTPYSASPCIWCPQREEKPKKSVRVTSTSMTQRIPMTLLTPTNTDDTAIHAPSSPQALAHTYPHTQTAQSSQMVSTPDIDDTTLDDQAESQTLVQKVDMSPPSSPRSQTGGPSVPLSRLGIELGPLLSSQHTKIRTLGNFTHEGQIVVNIIPNKLGGFLYFALRTNQAVAAEEGTVDSYLRDDHTLGTTVNIRQELARLRRDHLNTLHDAEALGNALDAVGTTMQNSGQRIRMLIDKTDGSIYFSTQDVTQTFYCLGLIFANNEHFGLCTLPPENTLSPPISHTRQIL